MRCPDRLGFWTISVRLIFFPPGNLVCNALTTSSSTQWAWAMSWFSPRQINLLPHRIDIAPLDIELNPGGNMIDGAGGRPIGNRIGKLG